MDPLLSATRVVIVVFVMPDCPACEAYVPRLNAAIRKAGAPFYVHAGKKPSPRGSIPVLYYDVSQPNEEVQAFASRFNIESTPTTIVLPKGSGVFKVEGGLAANQIDYVLNSAREMNR
jgi:thiol-disulfide isomerase/thioredoxin